MSKQADRTVSLVTQQRLSQTQANPNSQSHQYSSSGLIRQKIGAKGRANNLSGIQRRHQIFVGQNQNRSAVASNNFKQEYNANLVKEQMNSSAPIYISNLIRNGQKGSPPTHAQPNMRPSTKSSSRQ